MQYLVTYHAGHDGTPHTMALDTEITGQTATRESDHDKLARIIAVRLTGDPETRHVLTIDGVSEIVTADEIARDLGTSPDPAPASVGEIIAADGDACTAAGEHLPAQLHRWQECPVYHDGDDGDAETPETPETAELPDLTAGQLVVVDLPSPMQWAELIELRPYGIATQGFADVGIVTPQLAVIAPEETQLGWGPDYRTVVTVDGGTTLQLPVSRMTPALPATVDAYSGGYGGPSYWRYIELDTREKLARGRLTPADAERSLGEALAGNDGD